MIGSCVVYFGIVVAFSGLVFLVRPIQRWIRTRSRAAVLLVAGVLIVVAGFLLPAPEFRIGQAKSRLDHFAPVWQFHEFHTIRIAAPPSVVYEAVRQVRGDEILLFRTLTWIRRGGRNIPRGILNAGQQESLIDVATRTGFVRLADEAPKELVIGAVIAAPAGKRGAVTAALFEEPLPPGFTLATMNFIVRPGVTGGSEVSTETRVFANSPSTRRQFAAYWRLIYPGSSLIRRMWLRAIDRRATATQSHE